MSPTAPGEPPQGPVLVTGGAGYVGCHTVRRLERLAVPTVVYDDLSTGHGPAAGASLVVGSLGDREALARVFRERRPRAVIHFAARSIVSESILDPAGTWRENLVYTWNLLEEMRAAGCEEIVFSSTCAVYGDPQTLPIAESHPQQPVTPYGHTKLAIEQLMRDYARAYGLRVAALRYFNAAGAEADGSLGEVHEPETHLIPRAFRVALGRLPELSIFGEDYDTPDGTCIRDYVHVCDLAEAHVSALSRLQADAPPLACNLGTGRGHSVREVLETVRAVTGHALPTRVEPRRENDVPRLVADPTLARELLGWEARRPELRAMVQDAWRFAERHPDGYGASCAGPRTRT